MMINNAKLIILNMRNLMIDCPAETVNSNNVIITHSLLVNGAQHP